MLRPGSREDVIEMVRFCDRLGIKVTVRGQGHSTFGQTQNEGGLLIDMATLATVHEVAEGHALVDAGCTWHQVLVAALAAQPSQTPRVVTGFSLLSVGGTLSVGGISGMAYFQGCQVQHVLELEVVTGNGRLVVCSEKHERRLFEAVLAGQGQCAIILRARVALWPAPPRTRDYILNFNTLPELMAAMNTLLDEARESSKPKLGLIWGGAVPTPEGFVYPLYANAHYDPAAGPAPDTSEVFSAITLPATPPIVEDQTYLEYVDKIDRQNLALPKGPGRYPLWLDVFVSREAFLGYVGDVLARTQPDDMGKEAGLVLFFPLETSTNTRPLFRLPDSSRVFLFDYFRNTDAVPRSKAEELVARNYTLYQQGVAIGATAYPIGSVPLMPEDWKRHYGPAWEQLQRDKQHFDPHHTLGSGVAIFNAPGAAQAGGND
ncbi:MAG: FAD-binding protein [Myxococcaceae bacterium]|nr:FAD-binding protein [Myxococcaceae bacterium]